VRAAPLRSGLVLFVAAAAGTPAAAQLTGGREPDTDIASTVALAPDLGVAARPRPSFDPQGVRFGGIRFLPTALIGVGYVDNVYSSARPLPDGYGALNLDLAGRSDWNRHALALAAGLDSLRYFTYASENQTAWHANALGRLDIGSGSEIDFTANSGRSFEPRYSETAPSGTARPTPIFEANGRLQATYRLSSWAATLAGSAVRLRYDDVPAIGGGIVDQHYRDRTLVRVGARLEKGRGERSMFLEISHTRADYDVTSPIANDRSARDLRFLAGVTFDLTPLLRITASAGYIRRSFDQPIFAKIRGLTGDARLQYLVTNLVTLSLSARRHVEDSVIPGAGGYFATGGGGRIDYEPFRWLVLGLSGDVEKDDYRGIARRDRVTIGRAEARYLVNRTLEFGLVASHADRRSNGVFSTPDIRENRLMITTTLKR
jgi:hypothetical protein